MELETLKELKFGLNLLATEVICQSGEGLGYL